MSISNDHGDGLGSGAALISVTQGLGAGEAERFSELFGAICHDVRNPLNALLVQAYLLRASVSKAALPPPLDDAIVEALDVIRDNGRACLTLLEGILELGGGRSDVLATEYDLSDLVSELTRTLMPLARLKGLSVSGRTEGSIPIQHHRPSVFRILSNLIDNAVRYTRAGGVEIVAGVSREGAVISVDDTGPGVPPEVAQRIFELRVRALEADALRTRGGYGVGLYSARRLARALGGDITVAASSSGGSRFSLSLPIHPRLDRSIET
jgi:signal transduction histidine kinase